ncbi:hypothetical protein Bbelb_274410 [Branchiostoma belcheri]|nr:hypothetical protein Bbelb_274410 [Branchiostoma belcheri]
MSYLRLWKEKCVVLLLRIFFSLETLPRRIKKRLHLRCFPSVRGFSIMLNTLDMEAMATESCLHRSRKRNQSSDWHKTAASSFVGYERLGSCRGQKAAPAFAEKNSNKFTTACLRQLWDIEYLQSSVGFLQCTEEAHPTLTDHCVLRVTPVPFNSLLNMLSRLTQCLPLRAFKHSATKTTVSALSLESAGLIENAVCVCARCHRGLTDVRRRRDQLL